MKIFEFEFYDNYEQKAYWFDVLAHSKEEAEVLLRQEKSYDFTQPNVEFYGCIEVIELDKPRVL